jgi:hypothetical protein
VFYEEARRVPLLIRAPFLHRRQMVVDRPASSIDIVPTVLELLGRKAPVTLPGQSLVPFLEGKRSSGTTCSSRAHLPDGPHGRAVVSPEEKLVLFDRDHNLFSTRHRTRWNCRTALPRSAARGDYQEAAAIGLWQTRQHDSLALGL